MTERELYSQARLIGSLMRVGHGDLSLYVDAALPAAVSDPNLFAHFISWNRQKSEVRDGKVAFPVIAMRGAVDPEHQENAVAHILSLGPRELHRAVLFNKNFPQDTQFTAVRRGNGVVPGCGRLLKGGMKTWFFMLENNRNRWDRAVLSNRKAMLGLYTMFHRRPRHWVQAILFDKNYPSDSIFAAVRNLKNMSPQEAAGTILKFRIPFQVAVGACPTIKDDTVLLALMEGMTGNEVINSTGMLRKLGVFDNPVLKAAYDEAVLRAKQDKRVSTLKAQRAAESLSGQAKKRMVSVAEERIEDKGQIEGNWLVLGDKSGSMVKPIELSKTVAATVARYAEKCTLMFFDSRPFGYEVTGWTLDQIKHETRHITAGGYTSIGCGLELMRQRGEMLNGIVIVSDGGDNTRPYFHEAYDKYVESMGIEPMVYLLHVPGTSQNALLHNFPDLTMWEFGKDVDYYSLPNVVRTLKGGKFELLDEIFQFPLLTIAEALR